MMNNGTYALIYLAAGAVMFGSLVMWAMWLEKRTKQRNHPHTEP
jgi:hypothetical protein